MYDLFLSKQKELEEKLESKTRELQEMKEISEKQQNEIDKLKEEFKQIQTKSSNKQQPEIFDNQTIKNLKVIENIGNVNGNQIMKIALKFYVLKEIKIQKVPSENLQKFIDEYKALNFVNHPSIIQMHATFFNDEKLPPSILLDLSKMNLEQAIKNKIFSNVQLVFTIYQIAEGMKYVHFKKIIHRNLKPSNILVFEDGSIKISDFGISHLMTIKEQILSHGLNCKKFMAPELKNDIKYDEKVDIYSFGIIVYFILNDGEFPNASEDGKVAIPSKFRLLAQQLIDVCCNMESKNRPSFEIICTTLEENKFDILSLNEQEFKEVSKMIEQYKSRIPFYSQ